MSADPNKKSPRTFQCRDALWEKFDQMARELECSVDYLINDAMKQYAKQRNYVSAASGASGVSGMAGNTGGQSHTTGPSADDRAGAGYRQGTVPPTMQTAGRLPQPVAPNAGGYGNAAGRGAALPPPPVRGAAPPPQSARSGLPAPMPGRSGFPPPPPPLTGRLGANTRASEFSPQPVGQAAQIQPQRERSSPPPLDEAHGARGGSGYGREQQPAYANANANASASLTVIYNGERVGVAKDRFVIGRGKQSSDLTLKDPNVSRQHAMIEFQNGAYFMVDMGSTNGVEYNNQRIARKQIAEGDVFRICDHDLRFTFR
jgi:neural Wiskott-Aldrich syndrome protein